MAKLTTREFNKAMHKLKMGEIESAIKIGAFTLLKKGKK
jgi:hypothetical protein